MLTEIYKYTKKPYFLLFFGLLFFSNLFLSAQTSATQITHCDTLKVINGFDELSQSLLTDSGLVSLVQVSDNTVLTTETNYSTSFRFSGISFADWATIQSVMIYCEHYEQGNFSQDGLIWQVGSDFSDQPQVWATFNSVPIHKNRANKSYDFWDVTSYTNTKNEVNQLEFLIRNNDLSHQKPTFTDHIYLVVEWIEWLQPLPTVTISSPENGTPYDEGDTIQIIADASDENGSVVKVEFFEGPNKLGQDTSEPYQYDWKDVTSGEYTLKVIATDNDSAKAVSSQVQVTVNRTSSENVITVIDGYDQLTQTTLSSVGQVYVVQQKDNEAWPIEPDRYTSFEFSDIEFPPSAEIQSVVIRCVHYEEGSFSSGALEWQAGTGWPNSPTVWATKTDISIHKNKNNKAQDSWDLSSVVQTPEQFNQLELLVKNNDTAKKKSAYMDFIYVDLSWKGKDVVPPQVNVISPEDGSVLIEGDSLLIEANALDGDGEVVRVDFFEGNTQLGSSITPPYSYLWADLDAGQYIIKVCAVDNDSAETVSDEIAIEVLPKNPDSYIESQDVSECTLYNFNLVPNGNGRHVEIIFNQLEGSGDVTVSQYNNGPSNVPCTDVCAFYWDIYEDPNISRFNADLVFHYNQNDMDGYTESQAYIGIAKFSSVTNTWQWLGGDLDAGNNTVTVRNLKGFSTFALFARIFGDINGDGYVDAADLQQLGDVWHETNTGEFSEGSNARFFNTNKNTNGGDQIIDAADLQVFGDCWHNGIP